MTETFKDYYRILEIPLQADFATIKSAYRAMSLKWHPDKNPGIDVTDIMQDINEAYAILRDEDKRARYDKEYANFYKSKYQYNTATKVSDANNDWTYDYDVQDEHLKEDIESARKYAEELVKEFLGSFSTATKDAVKGAWGGILPYIIGGIIFFIVGSILVTIADYADSDSSSFVPTEILTPTEIPDTWTKYTFAGNAFSLYIPSTMELRHDYDIYTKELKDIGLLCNTETVVFQQKGLNCKSEEAMEHYCRLMVYHENTTTNPVNRSDEVFELTDEELVSLRQIVDHNVHPFQLLGDPTYQWIDVNGTKAIEIKYRRTGTDDNNTCCIIYLLFNYNEMAELILSYREQEAYLWKADFENVITTFRWE